MECVVCHTRMLIMQLSIQQQKLSNQNCRATRHTKLIYIRRKNLQRTDNSFHPQKGSSAALSVVCTRYGRDKKIYIYKQILYNNIATLCLIIMLLLMSKLYCSDSVVLQLLSRHMHQAFIAVGSLYNVLLNNSVRELIWNSFATFVDL